MHTNKPLTEGAPPRDPQYVTPKEDVCADVRDSGFSHSPPARSQGLGVGEIKMKELGNIRNDTLDWFNACQKVATFDQKQLGFLPLRVSPITTLL